MVLLLDHAEFKVDELTDVTDEGKDLANTIGHDRHGSEEVHYGLSDRLDGLDCKTLGGSIKNECKTMDKPKGIEWKSQEARAPIPTNLR
jgi:hypothetical protein